MLSFIIVNYSGLECTISCIKSIIEKMDKSDEFEVIIVDNSPTCVDFKLLQKHILRYKDIKIKVLRSENKGFGHANNYGVKNSSGEYIFMLNNDAELLESFDIQVISTIFEDRTIGLIAPRVLNPDSSVQANTSTFLNLFYSLCRFLRVGKFFYNSQFFSYIIKIIFVNFNSTASSYFNREENGRKARIVEWASGCALIVRRIDFVSIGMFDENIFMYFEDEELCFRYFKRRQRTYYFPEIAVKHYVGSSTKKIVREIEIEKIRSEFYYYRKHFPDKFSTLKFAYMFISFFLAPYNNRYKIISRAFKDSEI